MSCAMSSGSSCGSGMFCPGATVTLRVSAVSLHFKFPILRLWGLLGERGADYVRLQREIQAAAWPRLAASPDPGGLAAGRAELCVGELSLVEVVGVWHRCCVVSRHGHCYRVFLLDEGHVVVTSSYYLARGRRELFQLPPEVQGFVVADTLLGGGARVVSREDVLLSTCTEEAVKFLSCLHGKELSGLVQEVVNPQVIVLELPQLSTQMHHLGLAQKVTHSWFCQVLRCCLACDYLKIQVKWKPPACSLLTPTVPQHPCVLPSCQAAAATSDYFYPRLQLGVTEPVLVTHVSDPHHVYCQLQSMSQEICCLSDTMRHICHQGEQGLLPRVGSACAARGRDGQWYRALLLEFIAGEQEQQLARVIFVDYGRKETVSRANLCHLPVECFRMPVVTYACALQGVSDRGCGWSLSQIDALKALVLGKAVSARIDMFNSFEHLYYVSMFGENGINLNCLFAVEACCLMSQSVSQEQLVEEFPAEELDLPAGPPSVALTYRDLASSLAGVHQKLGVFHGAQVSYIRDPSEFWLQLREHCQLFRQLRQSMWSFYFHAPKLDDAGQDLQPGSLCCVKGKDGAFYRAVITAVQDSRVEAHLLDRGSMETVDPCVVKQLVSQFWELPALALKCCLAGVTPLRGSWSELSVSAFRELVLNKALKAHFLSVQGDKYVVDIFDESHLGEKSVSKLLAQGGFAECQGCEMPKALQSLLDKAESWAPAREKSQVNAEERLSEESDLKRNGGTLSPHVTVMVRESPVETVHSSKSSEAVPAQKYECKENLPVSQIQNDVEIKPSSSYRCQLEVGSTVDVVVSYIENPGYFWCQLSRTNQDLQLLMAEIQEYCKNSSQPRAWPDSLCLAQYSGDKKWYRAVITGKVSCAEKVEVLFVDFGIRVLVSLTDLRSAHECFLKLEAQAFRCSLYNLIQANGLDPFAWDKAAIQAFQEFVDTSSCFELKCTVFALASINNELFNIVDLMTPFQSVCQFLTDRGVARHSASQKCLVSSVQLHSYYYSMHGIEIGTEEDIFITHVEDPSTFYCQLERCAGHLARLDDSIRQLLSQTVTSRNTLQKCGTLCLAKYTDNHWYRGVITKTEPNMEVFFVDFGNTETMEKDRLLPLPSDACDVLLLPMQAIKCSLFDTAFVHKATAWFKEAVLEKKLKAIVVGRESDGKLFIELYDGNTRINEKLKEKFYLISSKGLYRPVENETLCSRNVDVNESDEAAETPLDAGSPLEREENRSEAHEGKESSERHFKEGDVNLFQPDREGELAAGLLESDEVLSTKSDGFLLNKAGEESLLPVQIGAQSDTTPECIMLQTGANLLQQKVVPALKVSVYLSYVNNPLDFYVQLESDVGQLNSISESLNDGTQAKDPCGQLLQAGDLISAVYSGDNLWYRAVVKEKISDSLVSVQYIDYGNTSVINVDQVHRLPEDLTSIPAIGIHCFLGGLKNTAWTEKAALDFTRRTSDSVLLTCEFVEKVEDQWEVILTDHQGIITVDLADENLEGSSEVLDRGENSAVVTMCEPLLPQAQNEISSVSDSKSFLWKFPVVGQTLKMYVTVANSPEYFWSRSADPEDMNYMSYIQKKIEEAENFGLKSWNDCRSCIKSGDICLVKYSQGGKFYRAEVSSVKGEKVFVRYVDYGIEEAVSMAMVKQIPCELLKVPNQAFACCLSGFNSSEGSWLNEAKEQFYCMTKDLLLEAEVIDNQEDKASEIPLSVVKLEASGKSINEEMKSFWKANKGTGDSFFSNLENPLKENEYSNKERGICIKRETTAVGGLAQGESESAWLCSETFLGVTSEFLHAAEANGSGGAVGFMPWKAGEGCETTDCGSSFEETLLPVGERGNHFLPEPMRSCSLRILGSERKAAGQELPEVSFQEDAELQAKLTGSVSAARLFLRDGQEPQRLPVLPGQPSSDGTGAAAAEVDHLLQMSPTYGDLKEFILQLAKKMALNLYETYKAEALQEAWPVEPPSLRLPSSSDRPQKQLDLKTHSVLSGLETEMEQLLVQESVVQPSREDGKELEHAAPQSSAGCGNPFAFLTEGFTSQRPVGIAKSRGCKVEKQEEWQKKYDCVEEWMEQDLTEGGNAHVQSSDFKPGPEEVEKKQNGNLADCIAEHQEYMCHLKGFAVGSKCVVWTSLKWCEALILEISERGTKVLNLTSGTEEVVDPENVWNGIPGWASGSAEAMTSAAENSQSLPEESLL